MYKIYKIINTDTGRIYIGMTKETLQRRFYRHCKALAAGNHSNVGLQADWNADHKFVIANITWRKTKEAAHKVELDLMNAQENPYNIAKGNKGDMCGFLAPRCTASTRPYVYAEITDMRKQGVNAARKLFDISAPMVSMVWNGHRTAPAPQTSFKDVPCCPLTIVSVPNPAICDFYAEYAGQA